MREALLCTFAELLSRKQQGMAPAGRVQIVSARTEQENNSRESRHTGGELVAVAGSDVAALWCGAHSKRFPRGHRTGTLGGGALEAAEEIMATTCVCSRHFLFGYKDSCLCTTQRICVTCFTILSSQPRSTGCFVADALPRRNRGTELVISGIAGFGCEEMLQPESSPACMLDYCN